MMKAQSTPVPLAWLHVIVACTFWHSCQWHDDSAWRKVNYFCKDCLRSMCQSCANQHKNFEVPHNILQIRRYWYNDVVSVANIEMHVNVTDIQTNNSNNETVVHLKTKGTPNSHSGGKSKLQDDSIPCAVCSYIIKRPYRFCSVACKLKQWHNEKQESPPRNVTSWVSSLVPVRRTGAFKIVINNSLWKRKGKRSSAALPPSQPVKKMAMPLASASPSGSFDKMASSQALASSSGSVEYTVSSLAPASPSVSVKKMVSSKVFASPSGQVKRCLKRGAGCSKNNGTPCSPISGDANK